MNKLGKTKFCTKIKDYARENHLIFRQKKSDKAHNKINLSTESIIPDKTAI